MIDIPLEGHILMEVCAPFAPQGLELMEFQTQVEVKEPL